MISNAYKEGRKITGFFGIFDVLGYSKMIESNDLDSLIKIYKNTLMGVDDLALLLEGLNKPSILAPIETKSFAFSDTIVLYQDMPKGPVMLQWSTINIFIMEVCYLLRLAFKLGIPLRGAISYGEYYIHEDRGCFIGGPVIEAHNEESKQNWSGATLCKSAWDKLYASHNESMEMQGDFRGIDLKGRFSPLIKTNQLWVKYAVPYYDKKESKPYSKGGIALCWHDAILDNIGSNDMFRIGVNNLENIRRLVREKFEANGKIIDDKTNIKIENTAQFLDTMQLRYIYGFTSTP